MSDTVANLRHKIASAGDLGSVVRTMKAMAAANITQYENAVRSLDDYYRTIRFGLAAGFRQAGPSGPMPNASQKQTQAVGAVVFGSDQGLVGRFNEVMADFVRDTLAQMPGDKIVWTVGERIRPNLADSGLLSERHFSLPGSIGAITRLVGQILREVEMQREKGGIARFHIFHHRPGAGGVYSPASQRLLPLDDAWRRELAAVRWPTNNLPQLFGGETQTLPALVREYLFISLFRACAESLASENASRLAAMQRAEKNIGELLEELNLGFHRLRQSRIDEELFDVVSGYEALAESQEKAPTAEVTGER